MRGPESRATTRPGEGTSERDRPVVAVLYSPENGPPPGLEPLDDVAAVRYASTAGELEDVLADAEALYVSDFRSTDLEAAWRRAGNLRWVHAGGAGVDALLFPRLVASDVTVTNSRGVFDRPIAEYVIGLVLAFAKDLPTTLALQRRHTWWHRETERLVGSRLLVIGAGPIGRAIVALARAFEMETTVLARSARASDPELGSVLGASDLRSALAEADYVVVAAPLTRETEGMIGAQELARMKPTARLINVGRGPVVDEEALLEALRSREIAGAALDVFVNEPLPPTHPFWDLPGMIVSPHMAGDFIGWTRALSELFLENYRRWLEGRPLLNVVDKERGYVVEPGGRS